MSNAIAYSITAAVVALAMTPMLAGVARQVAEPPSTPAVNAAPASAAPAPAMPKSPDAASGGGGTEVLHAGRGGHFFAEADIGGRRVPFMVDTGATLIALTHETAQTLGFQLSSQDFKYGTSTANGSARVAMVRLPVMRVGSIAVYDVQATVSRPGALRDNLLGMAFLGKLRSYEVASGRLILRK